MEGRKFTVRITENWTLHLSRAPLISESHSEVPIGGRWWIQVAVWVP